MRHNILDLDAVSVAFGSRGPFAYKTKTTVVNNINLTVMDGEVLGIVGESGSGKTTLSKAILGMVPLDSGRILYRDHDLTGLMGLNRKKVQRELQMVFQDPLSSFNPRHTIEKSLSIPLKIHKIVEKNKIDETIDELLEQVGLTVKARKVLPHELSGGQLQRVAIARALALQPSVLFADEAVSKLDVSVRAQILNLIKAIQQDYNLTTIFITHDLHVARFLCDRICIMYYGNIIEIGETETLFSKPKHPYTKALLGTIDKSNDFDIKGSLPKPDSSFAGCCYYNRCEYGSTACTQAQPELRDLFERHKVACIKDLSL